MPARDVTAFLAALRRRTWFALLIFGLATILAGSVYLLARRHTGYVATQTLVVSALAPDGGGASAALATQQRVDRAARELAAGTVFTEPALAPNILATLRANAGALDATYGAGTAASLASVSAPTIASAFSAARMGDQVTLAARWPTPGGARALAASAGQVLATHPEIAFADSPVSLDVAGATDRILLAGPVSAATSDSAQQAAARARLLWSLLLGLAAAIAFTALLAAWDLRHSRVPAAHASSV